MQPLSLPRGLRDQLNPKHNNPTLLRGGLTNGDSPHPCAQQLAQRLAFTIVFELAICVIPHVAFVWPRLNIARHTDIRLVYNIELITRRRSPWAAATAHRASVASE
jgi:hypothetical protein